MLDSINHMALKLLKLAFWALKRQDFAIFSATLLMEVIT